MSQVIQFTGSRVARMPDSKPETDDSYTKVPNWLLEQLGWFPLSALEGRMINVLSRKTFGFHKTKDRLADSVLAELMKIERGTANKIKNRLLERNIIVSTGSGYGKLHINANLNEWQQVEKATKPPVPNSRLKGRSNTGEVCPNDQHPVQNDTVCANTTQELCPITTHTKDKRQTTNNSPSESVSEQGVGREESEDPVSGSESQAGTEPETQPPAKPNPKRKRKPPATKPNAAIQNKSGSQWGELVDLKLAEGMARAIDRLLERPEPPNRNLTSWANTIRLMRERDLIDPREIRDVFVWANQDGFWKANILSPEKLREKFPQLLIRKKIESEGGSHEAGRRGGKSGESELDRQLTDLEYARNNF